MHQARMSYSKSPRQQQLTTSDPRARIAKSRTLAGCWSTLAFVAFLDNSSIHHHVTAFHATPSFRQRRRVLVSQEPLYASVGGGNNNNPPPPGGGGKKGSLDDYLDPSYDESEALKRAREFMSEKSLPISFGSNPEISLNTGELNNKNGESDSSSSSSSSSSALVGPGAGPGLLEGGASAEALAKNPYLAVVSQITPSDLITKFSSTAHPRVQNAVRTTILGLIGGLPKMAFDTKIITTGQRLASLMFQLQMTGYMFKNAEYRLSLSQSLGMAATTSIVPSSNLLLTGADDDDEDDDEEGTDPLTGKVRGKLKIRYGASSTTATEADSAAASTESDDAAVVSASVGGLELEVDAASYLSELRSEVSKLRDELTQKRQAKEEALRKDLLLYIRTLPEQQLRSLTNTISPDVLVAMKGLVNVVMAGISENGTSTTTSSQQQQQQQMIGADTVTEQSGEAMAQLCIWQLVVGYNLRELEVREEIRNSLMNTTNGSINSSNGYSSSPPDEVEGVDFSQPGALE